MTKRIVARWESGLRFGADSELGGHVELRGDPGDPGLRPSELLLTALVTCAAMDVISIVSKKRQPVAAYEAVATGEQRETHPKTFTEIVLEHRFTSSAGTAIDPAAVRRAIELSATRYCPVTAHVSAGDVRVHHRYGIDASESDEVLVTGPFGAGLQPDAG